MAETEMASKNPMHGKNIDTIEATAEVAQGASERERSGLKLRRDQGFEEDWANDEEIIKSVLPSDREHYKRPVTVSDKIFTFCNKMLANMPAGIQQGLFDVTPANITKVKGGFQQVSQLISASSLQIEVIFK